MASIACGTSFQFVTCFFKASKAREREDSNLSQKLIVTTPFRMVVVQVNCPGKSFCGFILDVVRGVAAKEEILLVLSIELGGVLRMM